MRRFEGRGDLGVRLYDGLVGCGHMIRDPEHPTLTDSGEGLIKKFGIDLDALRRGRAPLCRECLDWSERRSHLAGSLGRAMLGRFEDLKWVKRDPKTRIVTLSKIGEQGFEALVSGKVDDRL